MMNFCDNDMPMSMFSGFSQERSSNEDSKIVNRTPLSSGFQKKAAVQTVGPEQKTNLLKTRLEDYAVDDLGFTPGSPNFRAWKEMCFARDFSGFQLLLFEGHANECFFWVWYGMPCQGNLGRIGLHDSSPPPERS